MDSQLSKPVWVVKLGGSLLGTQVLMDWLEVIHQHGDGRVIIVPGGCMFADAVREAQATSGVNDHVAHHLALLAMDQYGLLLAGMHPKLVTASSELELAERSYQHHGIIWLPSKMLLMDEDLPKNWQVTSDSLSAWLAVKLKAQHLVLVKSADLTNYGAPAEISATQLMQDQIVDEQFSDFINSDFNTHVLNKHQVDVFQSGFMPPVVQQQGLSVKGH